MISFRPLMNSDRFLQRESIVYARATFAESRVFQAPSARRTFCVALSRVNGGKGGRADVVGIAMILLLEFIPSANLQTRVSMGAPACQQEIKESQRHHHARVDKERAESQHE